VAKNSIRGAAILAITLLLVGRSSRNAVAQRANDELSEARSLLAQGKNSEAIRLLKELSTRQPKLPGVHRELGMAYYRQGEYLDASGHLESAWRENRDDRDAAQLLGLSYYFSGKPAEAIPALEAVRAARPDANIDALYILGICYAVAERRADARQLFAQLYGVKPDSAGAHLLLARMLLRNGLDPGAESEARAALALSPGLPLAHLTLGEIAVYGGDYGAAELEFGRELAIDPAEVRALSQLGEVYWRLGRDEDAERVLDRAVGIEPNAAEPHVILGKILLRKGRTALAEENLSRALRLDPGSYTAHYLLGQLYRDQGRPEAAQRELAAASRIQQLTGPGRRN
jgi:tetratricopeptide (TPR) repeat protein